MSLVASHLSIVILVTPPATAILLNLLKLFLNFFLAAFTFFTTGAPVESLTGGVWWTGGTYSFPGYIRSCSALFCRFLCSLDILYGV